MRAEFFNIGERLLAHPGLDVAAFLVDRVERPGMTASDDRIVGQQAFDAYRHIFEPACRIDARPDRKPEVSAYSSRRLAAGLRQQCLYARDGAACTNTFEALLDENAVVVVQRHDVGNGAQGDEVQVLRCGFRSAGDTLAIEPAAERRHQVKSDADTSQVAARELTARQIRIDDDIGCGQFCCRQVMIRDEHLDATVTGFADACNTRNSVIDRDNQLWRHPGGDLDDFGREAIAEFKTIGHQVLNIGEAEIAQTPQDQRRTRGAVDIEVTDDDDAVVLVAQQQFHSGIDIVE
jgi:hypothetical protein